MTTAYLTVDKESDLDLIQNYALLNGINVKISKTLDLEDEIFGGLIADEETKETITLSEFLELTSSEN